MRRVLLLMAAAGALVWAGALLDFGGAQRAPRRAAPSASDAEPARAEAQAAPATGQASRPAPESEVASAPSSASPARAVATPGRSDAPRPGQGDVAVLGSRPSASSAPQPAASTAELTTTVARVDEQDPLRGELGEGVLSPEYAEIEQSYADEPRDGAWAAAEEQRIRGLLSSSAVREQVALVHCQETVCRIVLETESAEAFQELLQVAGLTAATGIRPGSPYSLRGGQLSVYFRRDREAAESARK